MAGRELARRIKEVAANAGPVPGNLRINQVQDTMAELNRWSGRDYEGEIPTSGPFPVTAPTVDDSPTDTVDELETLIFGKDLKPSGLDQEFPEWES